MVARFTDMLRMGTTFPLMIHYPCAIQWTIIHWGPVRGSHHNTFDSLKASIVTRLADIPRDESTLA